MRCRRPLALLAALVALAAAPLLTVSTVAGAQTAQLPPPRSDILVDAGTGRVLAGNRIHERLHPASTTKIFTALTAVERLAPDAIVTADARAAAVIPNKIGFTEGTRWPLDQMLAALMMVSANDAAYALAYTAGGGLDGFAAQLNATARRLGAKNSILGDPAGLDDETSYQGGPYTTAYDLAIATRNALAVPAIARWASTRIYEFTDPAGGPHQFVNHNRMLPGGAYGYEGAHGFKTGFTQRAQHSLVATATRNGRTLIAVVLGAPAAGYATAAALLDAGFAMAPDAPGTGEILPPNRFSPYADRAADRDAFARLGLAAVPAAGRAGGTAGVAPSIPELSAAPRAAAPARETAAGDGSGGFPVLRGLLVALLALGTVVVMLRRRAVKRQRARRLARRRQRLAAMRSGGLPVVDGRYRPGTRVGPPVESHVRIRRFDDPDVIDLRELELEDELERYERFDDRDDLGRLDALDA
jgi:D-alanyl-D-alanine carboxypeptidase (penicillin-binding protein 5/6)